MIEIPLTQGYITIINDEDADLAFLKWCAMVARDGRAYAVRRASAHPPPAFVRLHRIILERKLGHDIPLGMVPDHINHNPLDNRRENLRLATYSQNVVNCQRTCRPKHSPSPYRGVSWHHKGEKPWIAHIKIGGKMHHIGYFETAEDAARAFNHIALETRGKFAILNNVEKE
jgi:hypothetical protein